MWKFIGASRVGTSHVKTGKPCQDCISYFQENNYFLASVSDGAGSSAYSEKGSEAACAAISSARNKIEGNNICIKHLLIEIAEIARESISQISDKEGHRIRDYACTLLLFGSGPQCAAALQIGDGAIVYRLKGDEFWNFAVWPQSGEYANTTYFLTDSNYKEHINVVELPTEIEEVALITDGLEKLALNFSAKTTFKPFWDGIFQPVRANSQNNEMTDLEASLIDFLGSDKVTSRTDDDVSIILASKINDPTSRENN